MRQINQPKENLQTIFVQDENGSETEYEVDAVIEMENKEYVLYSSGHKLKMKRILHEDGDEFLLDVSEEEMSKLISAYQEAISEETKEIH
ncbi:DUF1292 domain-containing protein [Sediminibacillus albus]|uniref:DUF1292 domain-containing protein n=1 Tax=Sediminibacillus albus TaxID=407036 RepID=A0A1G9AQU4_9BACI|nr:DUF1292 domain-containing protein [Sediminibacillus albus]SDK28925.1 Protein of unknown function [Sediminibacillus albus]